MATKMNKGQIISAIDAVENASSKLTDVLRNATDDDILHAAEYAYTDGGTIKGDSQQPRLKVLRTTLIKVRELTVKRQKGVWVIEKPRARADAPKKESKDNGHNTVASGNRSKPSKSLTKAEDKAASMVEGREPADKVAAIARQMQRLGVTLAELEEYFAEQAAQQEAA